MWRPAASEGAHSGGGGGLRRSGGTFADIFSSSSVQGRDEEDALGPLLAQSSSSAQGSSARTASNSNSASDSRSPSPPAAALPLHDPSSSSSVTNSLAMRQSASSAAIIDLTRIDDWRRSVQKPLTYKMGSSTIRFQKPLVAAMGVVFAAMLLLLYVFAVGGRRSSRSTFDDHFQYSPRLQASAGASSSSSDSYNTTYPLSTPTITEKGMRYRIALISDLDEASKVEGKKDTWRSYLKHGYFTFDTDSGKAAFDWDESAPAELLSSLSTGGRGMELSELVVFDGRLYTVDDRTGVVYRVEKNKVVPWQILSDGPGSETKGFKSEWCTVKDQHLYVGGLGKEWTTPDGTVLNFNPMYVKRIPFRGEPEHVDWHDNYIALRKAAGIEFPGYMIHESAAWSEIHKKWFFLPRRASKNKYNDVDDERMGTNLMLTASEDFSDIRVTKVGTLDEPSHGFSSFKFVPGTDDGVIVALKSQELQGKIASFVMVFRVKDGEILYPETKVGDHKYEGIEFV